jgi:beta-carotene 3-hydroxylase
MEIFVFFLIMLTTFFVMEGVAWFTHKYVMHGFFWMLHDDHHNKTETFFEKNDLFFVIFAVPSFLCILFGALYSSSASIGVGLGIALYGLGYFLVHDIFIHQRFKIFTKSDNVYLRAIRKAHKIHHKSLKKEQGECFGMLIVPMKYFVEAYKFKKAQG